MNDNRKKQIGLLLIVVVMVALLAAVTGEDAAARGRKRRARVLSPKRAWYGQTYDEWAADWWQWAADLPADDAHPLIADGKMDCSLGQKGKVWFLGGTYADEGSGEADRTCDEPIPAGKALFFPVVNILCSEFTGDDPDLLLECAADPPVPPGWEVQVNPLSATIDGRSVRRLQRYYTLSQETFALGPLPDPNIFGVDEGAESQGATSGYYLLLAPLSKGEHVITFVGEIKVWDDTGAIKMDFTTDISYVLTYR